MGPRRLLKKFLPQRERNQLQPQSLKYPAANTPNPSLTTSTISTQPPEYTVNATISQNATSTSSSDVILDSSPPPPKKAVQPLNGQICDPLGHNSELWEQAKNRISPEDHTTIEKFVTKERGSLKFEASEISDVIHSLQGKGRLCKERQWTFPCGKYTLSLQKAAEKTLYWLDKIKAPVEVAVSADPIHAALPWAAIKCLVLVRKPICPIILSFYLTRNRDRWSRPKRSK